MCTDNAGCASHGLGARYAERKWRPSGWVSVQLGTRTWASLYVSHVLLGRLHVSQYPCQRWARRKNAHEVAKEHVKQQELLLGLEVRCAPPQCSVRTSICGFVRRRPSDHSFHMRTWSRNRIATKRNVATFTFARPDGFALDATSESPARPIVFHAQQGAPSTFADAAMQRCRKEQAKSPGAQR